MTRAQKIAALVELWQEQLHAVHGFLPRAVDKRDYARHLAGCSSAQLDSALTARGIDPATGKSTHVGPVW